MNNEERLNNAVGKTVCKIDATIRDELVFFFTDGTALKFYHEQDCCEDVAIEDICGDLQDLIGVPLLSASERTSGHKDTVQEVIDKLRGSDDDDSDDSQTWTFYVFETFNGAVTVRWLGESNGYYSESVDSVWSQDGENWPSCRWGGDESSEPKNECRNLDDTYGGTL